MIYKSCLTSQIVRPAYIDICQRDKAFIESHQKFDNDISIEFLLENDHDLQTYKHWTRIEVCIRPARSKTTTAGVHIAIPDAVVLRAVALLAVGTPHTLGFCQIVVVRPRRTTTYRSVIAAVTVVIVRRVRYL